MKMLACSASKTAKISFDIEHMLPFTECIFNERMHQNVQILKLPLYYLNIENARHLVSVPAFLAVEKT